MVTSMTILGASRLIGRFEGMKHGYSLAIKEALQESGVAVQDEATRICPWDTGNLAGSIRAYMKSNKEVRVGTNVEYGIYQEYGTSKMAAQPFMRPGLSKARPAIKKAFSKHFKKTHIKFSIAGGIV